MRLQRKIEEKFEWWTTIKQSWYECSYLERNIEAADEEKTVFKPTCRIRDNKCELGNSIIIWNKQSLSEKCPLVHLQTSLFKLDEGIFIDKRLKIAFEFRNIEKFCDKTLYKTTEGIYLELIGTLKDLETHSHHHNKLDSKALAELTLGDIDYRSTLEVKQAKMTLKNECNNLKTIMRTFQNFEDKFILTKGPRNKDLILWTQFSQIYIPLCIEINEIDLEKDIKNCYIDLQIQFKLKNKTRRGFLTKQGIIRDSSMSKPCIKINEYFELGNNLLATKFLNKIEVVKRSEHLFENFNWFNITVDNEFNHLKQLTEGIDLIEQQNKLMEFEYSQNSWRSYA